MGSDFPVLLVDDGELDDVRDILTGLGIDFAHLRGAAVPARVQPPRDLFVTNSRRALLAREWPLRGNGQSRPVKIAVVDEDSQTLRAMLRRIGFDFLVRRPVHPVALRLLVTRALFQGDDQRGEKRTTIGYPVTVRTRFRRRSAVLADLSLHGCSLVAEHAYDAGTSLAIQLPAELTGGRGFNLRGQVVRSTPEAGPEENRRQMQIAVSFGRLDEATRARVSEILRERSEGPAVIEAASATSRPGANRKSERKEESGPERRRHARARFEREVVALAGDARRVLLGRDLSAGGMLIDPHPELRLGARLQLAIYGSAREEPFLIDAEVIRDEGDRGLALRFRGIEASMAARLERIVAGLPAVESLRHGEVGSLGTVLTEIRSA